MSQVSFKTRLHKMKIPLQSIYDITNIYNKDNTKYGKSANFTTNFRDVQVIFY